ncbi:rod shape-determining protein MreC [Natronobacillus azotifigens]|uniref:Cell shape-determining protein MreC n=1 Tax=Natronobacillus azotifigens TaxID=472978 RepID=A0A9J6RA36_9BACI|nr:rod shape-determining protein MreC [Natronobacillus azotifigens]MCZ0702399.1 rod shape-determining protein MreC [Natronobacillus azotifigens]
MSFFRRKRLFTILLGFIILVSLIGFSMLDRDDLSAAEEFLQDTIGWLQQIVLTPINYTTNVIDNIDDMKNVYEENKVLKQQLATYQQTLYEVQELRKENDDLMSILDKTNSLSDYQPIQATITARSPEQWFKLVTINKGKQHGVEKDMAVITGKGMIGKIQSTSQFTSTVLLLNGFDRSNRISVNVNLSEQDEDARGFILGYNEDREQLLLEFTDYYEGISEGEYVFSSGLGGVFPKGLQIGTIEEVTTDQYGLTQIAYIKPSADLYDLNHVIVVDREMPTSREIAQDPEITDEEDEENDDEIDLQDEEED